MMMTKRKKSSEKKNCYDVFLQRFCERCHPPLPTKYPPPCLFSLCYAVCSVLSSLLLCSSIILLLLAPLLSLVQHIITTTTTTTTITQ